ncbi:MAG: hypothetical protein GXO78_02055 [Calditrichaeota bacterium]|nr:hypothetical protein [Calditrichota bacterium]
MDRPLFVESMKVDFGHDAIDRDSQRQGSFMFTDKETVPPPIVGLTVYGAIWGIFYLLLVPVENLPYPTLIVSWLYATLFVGVLLGINRLTYPIIHQVNASFYVLLRSLFYLTGIVYAIVLIGLFHFLIILPPADVLQDILNRIISVVATVLSALSVGKRPDFLTVEWVMRELSPIIALLAMGILLALFLALLISYVEMLNKHRQLQEAQLRLLQRQMEPHFLFNALNTIAAEIKDHPRLAEELVIALADFYRTTFQISHRETVTLAQEVALARRYLDIQKARFGERLGYRFLIAEECQTLQVPPLIIQPLVENAIQHGWCDRQQPLQIEVSCEKMDDHLLIRVRDTGGGFQKKINPILQEKHSLANIHQRLKMRFGRQAGIIIQSDPGKGSVVSLKIPVRKGGP